MRCYNQVVLAVFCIQTAAAIKVKVVMHSEQDDSKIEDEDIAHTDSWYKKTQETSLPFIKTSKKHTDDKVDYEEEKSTTETPKLVHPNDMIFPLIYRQTHINSMFKFGENWYTWSSEKRTDGSKATNYYICYDEPKHCDDVGWVRTIIIPFDVFLPTVCSAGCLKQSILYIYLTSSIEFRSQNYSTTLFVKKMYNDLGKFTFSVELKHIFE